jgi:hypothetical protein
MRQVISMTASHRIDQTVHMAFVNQSTARLIQWCCLLHPLLPSSSTFDRVFPEIRGVDFERSGQILTGQN